MLWNNLTSAEAEFTQHVLQTLKNEEPGQRSWLGQSTMLVELHKQICPSFSKLALLTPCTGAGLNLITNIRPA